MWAEGSIHKNDSFQPADEHCHLQTVSNCLAKYLVFQMSDTVALIKIILNWKMCTLCIKAFKKRVTQVMIHTKN